MSPAVDRRRNAIGASRPFGSADPSKRRTTRQQDIPRFFGGVVMLRGRAASPCALTRGRRLRGRRLLLVAGVAGESTRGCELTQLVADHVLRDEHRDELTPVVHREGEPDRLWIDRRAPRPRLDGLAGVGRGRLLNLLQEVPVDERTLLDTARHLLLTLCLSPRHDHPVGALVVARLQALGELAPGRTRVATATRATFTTAHRVIHRVHRDTAVVWTLAEPARAPGLAQADQLVLREGDLADAGAAIQVDAADFTARQPH